MRFRYALAIPTLAAVLLAPVPVAAQDREQLQMLAELRMIQEQSGQLRALIAGLEASISALTAKLDQQANDTRKGFADQKLQIDGLRDGVSVVREKIDDTNVRISTLTHEVETLRATMATQPQPAAPAASDPNAPAGDPSSPSAPPASTPPVPAGPPAA